MTTDRDRSDRDRRRLRDYIPRPTEYLSAEILADGIEVTVDGPEVVEQDSPATFVITFKNRFPFTIKLPVKSRPWTWSIDGIRDGDVAEPEPDGPAAEPFTISSRESETVQQYWSGRVRRRPDGPFEPLEKGQHDVSVVVNAPVEDPPRGTLDFKIE